ncbi:hypothetical protein HD597_006993 [Nonomuraea thailandensis]|uniref:Uncharacterized protein n=1 Tax=Nonomuraea thailandensis TaxID=1188745 RepID=A0A9X2GSB3_9ACTN|nr:hypothetical protein [Nonomuraea thailandensis]
MNASFEGIPPQGFSDARLLSRMREFSGRFRLLVMHSSNL